MSDYESSFGLTFVSSLSLKFFEFFEKIGRDWDVRGLYRYFFFGDVEDALLTSLFVDACEEIIITIVEMFRSIQT